MSKSAPFAVVLVVGLLALPAVVAQSGMVALATQTVGVKESGCTAGRTFCFDKDEFSVPAGQQVTVTLSNNGQSPHSLCIVGLPEGEKCTPNAANGTPAGAQSTVQFTAPTAAGTYAYVCRVAGHDTLGMKGNMTVASSTTGGTPTPTPPATGGDNMEKKSPGVADLVVIGMIGALALVVARRRD